MAAHSIELLLDDASDAAVRAQWTALLDADLPSRARNPSPTNAPHVTLLAASHLPPDLDPALAGAVGALPLEVRLGPVVLFGTDRPVLARLVVPTAELLALHARAYAVVAGSPHAGHLLGHAAPGEWTPHVTLARGIPRDRLGGALAAVGGVTEPPTTVVASARRWDPEAGTTTRLGESVGDGSG